MDTYQSTIQNLVYLNPSTSTIGEESSLYMTPSFEYIDL